MKKTKSLAINMKQLKSNIYNIVIASIQFICKFYDLVEGRLSVVIWRWTELNYAQW